MQHFFAENLDRLIQGSQPGHHRRILLLRLFPRQADVAIQGIKTATQLQHVHGLTIRIVESQGRQILFNLTDQPELFRLILRKEFGDGIHAGYCRQLFDPLLQFHRLRHGIRDDRREQHRAGGVVCPCILHGFGRRINELFRKLNRRQTLALHVEQVVIEIHLLHLPRRSSTQYRGHNHDRHRAAQPEVLDALPMVNLARQLVIQHILSSAQQQHRQQCQHRHETDEQAAAANNAHLLNPLEIREPHRQKRARSRKGARKDPLPRKH